MSPMIGIKVANGDFFPIVAENKNISKRLILTTAHDAQPSVQIDFYKSSLMSMKDAVYIGTLLLKNISKKKQGSPSIEMVVSSNGDGEFSASAYDIEHPEEKGRHLLEVSLAPLEKSANFDDINLEHEYALAENNFSDIYGAAVKPARSKLLLIVIPLLLIIAFGVYFFMARKNAAELETAAASIPAETIYEEPPLSPPPPFVENTPPAYENTLPAEENHPPVNIEPPPVIKAAETPVNTQTPRKRDPAPVSSYNTPDVIPAEGIAYKLRWGDTLWDVSQAFYRTPWRYGYLARYNGIRNANHIVSGRMIRVPPLPK